MLFVIFHIPIAKISQPDFDPADTSALILGLLKIEPEKREPLRLGSLLSNLMQAFLYLVLFGFLAYVWWRIVRKTGFTGALLWLLTLGIWIPGVGIVLVLLFLGFSEWPVSQKPSRR